jgi:hypothetical protein
VRRREAGGGRRRFLRRGEARVTGPRLDAPLRCRSVRVPHGACTSRAHIRRAGGGTQGSWHSQLPTEDGRGGHRARRAHAPRLAAAQIDPCHQRRPETELGEAVANLRAGGGLSNPSREIRVAQCESSRAIRVAQSESRSRNPSRAIRVVQSESRNPSQEVRVALAQSESRNPSQEVQVAAPARGEARCRRRLAARGAR